MDNLVEKSPQELSQELQSAKKVLFDLKMKKCSGQLDRGHVISLQRKKIAQIETFLNKKTCKN